METIIYIILSSAVFIIGIAILLTGIATNRKPLKLAGIVIAIIALQYIVFDAASMLLAKYFQ